MLSVEYPITKRTTIAFLPTRTRKLRTALPHAAAAAGRTRSGSATPTNCRTITSYNLKRKCSNDNDTVKFLLELLGKQNNNNIVGGSQNLKTTQNNLEYC
jgi:hypothetical protein